MDHNTCVIDAARLLTSHENSDEREEGILVTVFNRFYFNTICSCIGLERIERSLDMLYLQTTRIVYKQTHIFDIWPGSNTAESIPIWHGSTISSITIDIGEEPSQRIVEELLWHVKVKIWFGLQQDEWKSWKHAPKFQPVLPQNSTRQVRLVNHTNCRDEVVSTLALPINGITNVELDAARKLRVLIHTIGI